MLSNKNGKKFIKRAKIQRLITPERLLRKKELKEIKKERRELTKKQKEQFKKAVKDFYGKKAAKKTKK